MSLLLASLALAGCSGAEAPRGQQDETGEEGGGEGRSTGDRVSDAGDEEDGVPHDTVRFGDQAVSLVGQDTQTFSVTVPANVTIVDFRISSPGPITEFGGLRVELGGCGAFDMGQGSSSGSIGGASSYEGRLCNDATEGTQSLTVSNLGYVEGTITLVGQVPKPADNATSETGTATSGARR